MVFALTSVSSRLGIEGKSTGIFQILQPDGVTHHQQRSMFEATTFDFSYASFSKLPSTGVHCSDPCAATIRATFDEVMFTNRLWQGKQFAVGDPEFNHCCLGPVFTEVAFKSAKKKMTRETGYRSDLGTPHGQTGAMRGRPVAIPAQTPERGGAHDAQRLLLRRVVNHQAGWIVNQRQVQDPVRPSLSLSGAARSSEQYSKKAMLVFCRSAVTWE